MKIEDISIDIASICIQYYIHHIVISRITNDNLEDLIKYISYNIKIYFNMKYTDNPDIESLDISSSFYEKRFELNNYNNQSLTIPENIIQECINMVSTNRQIVSSEYDYISLNVIPFDGFIISSYDIISIINNYLY